jgi:hypothetical protein
MILSPGPVHEASDEAQGDDQDEGYHCRPPDPLHEPPLPRFPVRLLHQVLTGVVRDDARVLPLGIPPVVRFKRVVYPLCLRGYAPDVPEVGSSPSCLVVISPYLLDDLPVEPLEYGWSAPQVESSFIIK